MNSHIKRGLVDIWAFAVVLVVSEFMNPDTILNPWMPFVFASIWTCATVVVYGYKKESKNK